MSDALMTILALLFGFALMALGPLLGHRARPKSAPRATHPPDPVRAAQDAATRERVANPAPSRARLDGLLTEAEVVRAKVLGKPL